MKGYVLEGKNIAKWHDDLPIPSFGSYGALIKPVIVAACTSDVHLKQTAAMPIIIGKALGHEMAGIVEKVGSEVKDFKPGDRVVVTSNHPAWRSVEAQDGHPLTVNECHYFSDSPDRGGVFAEYYSVVDADMTLAHIPDSVTWEQAVVISDMTTTAFSGVEKLEIKYGDTIVILGIGPVGLTGICGAALKGAARIIAIGSRKKCAEIAKAYGANDIINYKDGEIVEQVLKLTGGKPVDGVLITGGNSDSIGKALQMVKQGGIVSNIAMYFEDSVSIPLEALGFGINEKELKVCQAKGGRNYAERLLSLVENGRYNPELIVGPVFHGMEKVEHALDLMEKHDPSVVKPIVYFD